MRNRLKATALRVLNARYSVSSWLWIIVSTVSAVIMLFLVATVPTPQAALFLDTLPFNGYLWAGGLVATGLCKMYGMARAKPRPVIWGSMIAFCLWFFGAVTFLITGEPITVVLIVAPIMVFNASLFLGETLRDGDQM